MSSFCHRIAVVVVVVMALGMKFKLYLLSKQWRVLREVISIFEISVK
jgi:hypothetical protein